MLFSVVRLPILFRSAPVSVSMALPSFRMGLFRRCHFSLKKPAVQSSCQTHHSFPPECLSVSGPLLFLRFHSFPVKVKFQLYRIVRQIIFRVCGRFKHIVECTLTNSIHRIYVPPPYFTVRYTVTGIMVIYPVYFYYTLLITDSVPLSHIGLIVHRRFYFRFIGTDVKRHFCAYRYPATSFTLSADFLNGFASLLSKDPRGIFYNFLYFTCTVASTAQGYFRRFLHFLYHSSIIYDSVIPRGIGFHIPFSFLISARINCLLTSGW